MVKFKTESPEHVSLNNIYSKYTPKRIKLHIKKSGVIMLLNRRASYHPIRNSS